MMGRAGRPQFDSHGVAVIMTQTQVCKDSTLVLMQTSTPTALKLPTNGFIELIMSSITQILNVTSLRLGLWLQLDGITRDVTDTQ